jgi:iron(III) transport system substrate-binding protein
MPLGPARVLSATLATLVLLTATACGDDSGGAAGNVSSPAAAAVEAVDGLDATARTAELKRRAKAEQGDVRLYTSLDERVAAKVLKRFTADTGVRVEVYRAKSESVLERVSKEARADADGADLVDVNGLGLVVLERQGALTAFTTPAADKLVAGAVHRGWIASRAQAFAVSWNTDAVSDAERPRRLADLAEPRWKGRVAIEDGDWDWYLTVREHWMRTEGLSREEADERFRKIARNARVVQGHSFQTQLVGSGEFDVAAADYSYMVEAAKAEGAPIAWRRPAAPVVSRQNGLALARHARRPAQALLLADWLLGPGQDALAEEDVPSVRRDLVDDLGVDVLHIDDTKLVDRQREGTADYQRIIRDAGKGPEER